MAFISTSFVACDDDDNDSSWKDKNLRAYQEVVKDSDFKEVSLPKGPEGIYRRKIKSGNGTESPIQTSLVKIYYKGYYYDGTVFDSGTSAYDDATTASFYVSNLVRGFSVALQTMVVGDRWEIVVPYYLGYGATPNYSIVIPGYTTLFFEVELVDFEQYPN